MEFLHALYVFALAHSDAAIAFLAILVPSLITGLTPYPKTAGFVSFLRIAMNVLSVLSHHDSPGTFKLPLTVSKDPDLEKNGVPSQRGYAGLPVLIALAVLTFAFAALAGPNPEALKQAVASDSSAVQPAEDPPPPAPKFGGCLKSGRICFGPSVALTTAAINLSTKTIEAAFKPGIGIGMSVNPGKWSSFGADLYFVLDPGPSQTASAALLLKILNGYARFGVSKGFLGDKSFRIPLAFGVDL